MTTTKPDWEQLNAYVDGELDAAAAARVARAVAEQPDLARQVATLSALIHATGEAIAPPAMTLPAGPGLLTIPRMLAAALVLFAVVGLAGVAAWTPDQRQAWLDSAWATHHRIVAGDTDVPAGQVQPAHLPGLATALFVPDLSAARLTVATIERVAGPGGSAAVAVGYRGTRGCRLTLLVFAGGDWLDESLTSVAAASGDVYGWRIGEHGYLALAEGMAAARFTLIARSLYAATVRQAALKPEMRMALRDSRRTSPPCQHA